MRLLSKRIRLTSTQSFLFALGIGLIILFSMIQDALVLGILLLLTGSIVGYLIWNHLRWIRIEELNQANGITRDNAYIDPNGYLRWKVSNKLCHRDIAWNSNKRGVGKFGESDIHHIDENKFNNNPDNLTVLSREAHQQVHGQIIEIHGQKYRKLAHMDKIYRRTDRAYLIANTWIPISQTLLHDDCVYIPEWLYQEKGFG